MSVRLSHRYTSGCFIEINSHSLFSKWFSESGKLVQKLFEGIREIAEDPEWCRPAHPHRALRMHGDGVASV